MKAYQTFYFERYEYDEAARVIRLQYSLDRKVHFTDEVEFLFEPKADYDREVFARVLRGLWLMSGVSYIKTALPPRIVIDGDKLAPAEADFFSNIYRLGLGQLVYEQGLSLDRIATFPADAPAGPAPLPYAGVGDLVGFGGGKDSLVSTAVLDSGDVDYATFSATYLPVSNSALAELAKRVGRPHLAIQRRFDPQLHELNRDGAYNGHIPVTAVIAFIGLAAAVLTGRSRLIFSNEASAGEGNVEYEGVQINHQYSKTLEFERLLSRYIHDVISPGLASFSLLRPLGELQIAEVFARDLYDRYAGHFSSCNRNFQHHQQRFSWCGKCPKCAFVFLIMAPFVPKDRLVNLIGHDLLADPELDETYRELLGLSGHKPFECVGEIDECRAALRMALETGNYPEAKRFKVPEGSYDYRAAHESAMPSEYLSLIKEYIAG